VENEIIDLLYITAMKLRDACTVGDQAPRVKEMYELIYHPKPGEYVAETSTGFGPGRGDATNFQKIGRLVLVRDEQIERPECDWGENEEDRYYPEKYTYIELFDGTLFRWHNASFITIPGHQYWADNLYAEWGWYNQKDIEKDNAQWVSEAIIRHRLEDEHQMEKWREIQANIEREADEKAVKSTHR